MLFGRLPPYFSPHVHTISETVWLRSKEEVSQIAHTLTIYIKKKFVQFYSTQFAHLKINTLKENHENSLRKPSKSNKFKLT